MKNLSVFCFTGLLVFLSAINITAQEKSNLSGFLEIGKLEPFNRKVSQFTENGRQGIRFSKNPGDGIAWLKGVEFSNGTIEVDIRGKDAFQQSFVGIAFHGADDKTLDAVYFRPFNFRSDDPVRKIHAVQYVSHPDNTWDVLRAKQNGKYEKAVLPAPDGNDWFHAKIVVKYHNVTVYVNGTETDLNINKLNERKSGKVGLWVGNNSDGDFANLRILGDK